jgi:hypothetical protein
MKQRADHLEILPIDPAHAAHCRKRLAPLIGRYWMQRGQMDIDDLVMSAYVQGLSDGMQLPAKRPHFTEPPSGDDRDGIKRESQFDR